jgi:dipeptidyl aminopeptidase/acylaminoacyl peptidase
MSSSNPVTFESLLGCRIPSSVAISPDGARVAFAIAPGARSVHDEGGLRLWTGEVGGAVGEVPGAEIGSLLSWSPDGSRLAFAADRGQGLLGLSVYDGSGRVRSLAGPPGSVEGIHWTRDSSRLLVLAADPGSTGANASNWKQIEAPGGGRDPRVVRPDEHHRRLYLVELESGAATRVGPRDLNVWEAGWNGEDVVAAIVSEGSSESAFFDAALAVIDLEAGEHRVVYRPEWQMQSPVVSWDGTKVAVVEGWSCDRAPITVGIPTVVDLASNMVSRPREEIDVQRLRWMPSGSLFFVGEANLDTMCGFVEPDGAVDVVWRGPATLGETHIHDAAISMDGALVAACKEAPGEPPEVMLLRSASPERGWERITNLNESLKGLVTPQAERFTWTSDGTEIEGVLLTPPGPVDARLPLVVIAHGGPAAAWTMSYSAGYEHLGLPLANHGYAVLLPNTRGSTGRGQAFARAHLGAYGPMDLEDIVAGIEALHERGIVDRDRVGITGVSGGGYIAAYAATCSQAFRASVPRACISDWLSFHLTSTIGRFDEIVLKSDPYDKGQNHVRLSPVMHAGKATTPTLIMHGSKDTVCPPGQGQELYQALVDAEVEVELVLYAEAGHSLTEREYLLDMWQRTVSWFDRHLSE